MPIKPAPKEEGGSNAGLIIGGIGVLAAAAIAFFALRGGGEPETSSKKTAATVTETAEVVAKTAEAVATAAPTANPDSEAPKDDGALDLDSLDDASAKASADPAAGPLPSGAALVAKTDDVARSGPVVPEKVDPNTTLDQAMKDAANVDPNAKKDDAVPAGDDGRPKNVPDQPPQGSVTAAVGKVMGAARACVAGADDVSRATITFGSSGAVSSVSVTGWAAKNGASGCIQSALKGANVGPFSKPTYSFGVAVRP